MADASSRRTDAGVQGVKFDLQLPPKQKLIAQPPADQAIGDAAMFHYTWGTIWKDASGSEVWKFDKRFYTDANLELQVGVAAAALSTRERPCLGLCACCRRSGFTMPEPPAGTCCAVAEEVYAARCNCSCSPLESKTLGDSGPAERGSCSCSVRPGPGLRVVAGGARRCPSYPCRPSGMPP